MPLARFNEAMAGLCAELERNSSNYTPRVQLYRAAGLAGRALPEVASAAVGGPVEIGGAAPTTLAELLAGVTEDLAWGGDSETHVYDGYLASPELAEARDAALADLRGILGAPGEVTAFWIAEGHPFYPVFWDFAFRVDVGADAYVLIGSGGT